MLGKRRTALLGVVTLCLNITLFQLSLKFGRRSNKNWTENVNLANTAQWHPRSPCPKITYGISRYQEGVGPERWEGVMADPICCRGVAARAML